jgi:hypothetical protein
MELSQDTFYFHSGKSFYLFSFSRIYQSNTPQVYKKNLSSVDIKGKILIIFVYFRGLVVMLNLGSRNVWINGRCCVLV